ncbi:MAG: acyltransferase domain-containing protein, partial [Clostridiaceae bacterium]|nr:acyltransferase domain-containing protein [Clostridiaceae bacterium]
MSEKIIYPAAGSRELTAFADGFMARYDYPEAAVREFDRIFARLESEADFAPEMAETVENYMFPTADGMDEALKKLASMAERFGENEHTLDFVFVLCCLPILKVRYAEAGIGEDIFYNTCDDLRCKLGECIECEGVPGTFVASWYNGILAMEIFGLGRFEYELWEHDEEDYIAPCGKALRYGDPEINFHIPSSGVPITDEARLDSYKRAYEFYKD